MISPHPELRALSAGWRRPRRLGVVEWAHQYITLPGAYSQPGKLNLNTSRYMIAPLEAMADHAVEEVDVLKAVKMGGTMIVEIALAYLMCTRPRPTMWTMQTDPDATEHMKGRGWAFLKSIAPFRAMLPRDRSEITTLSAYFDEWFFLINGANKNNLQSKDIGLKVNSELWLWKQGLMEMAKNRTAAFARQGMAKIINESHASVADTDWHKHWLTTDQRTWAVSCAKCGAVRPIEFFGRMEDSPETHACVVWDKEAVRDDGTFDETRLRASTRYKCVKCGHEEADSGKTRVRWNDDGLYLKTRHDVPASRQGYRFTSLLGHSLGEMAALFLRANYELKRGNKEPMSLFYLQRLELWWKEEIETLKVSLTTGEYTFSEVARAPAEKIAGEALRAMVIDVQADHFWAWVIAARANGDDRLLFASKLRTEEGLEEVRTQYGVEANRTFADMGHNPGGKVYDMCARHGYIALHGEDVPGYTWGKGNGRHTRFYSSIQYARAPREGRMVQFINLATKPLKDMLAAALRGDSFRIEFPADLDSGLPKDESVKWQLQGEVLRDVLKKKTGRIEPTWVKVHANHYWDIGSMWCGVKLMLGLMAHPQKAVTVDAAAPSDGDRTDSPEH